MAVGVRALLVVEVHFAYALCVACSDPGLPSLLSRHANCIHRSSVFFVLRLGGIGKQRGKVGRAHTPTWPPGTHWNMPRLCMLRWMYRMVVMIVAFDLIGTGGIQGLEMGGMRSLEQ